MFSCFALVATAQGLVVGGLVRPGWAWSLVVVTVATGAAVYGLRGLYFAVCREAKVPLVATSTAAGLVSVVGYTPDVFTNPLMGWCTDTWPGATGHRALFAVLCGFSVLGMVATAAFRHGAQRRGVAPPAAQRTSR